MVARYFHISLSDVNNLFINEYRLMVFTVFNSVALELGMGGFKFKTREEENEQFRKEILQYKKQGFFKKKDSL